MLVNYSILTVTVKPFQTSMNLSVSRVDNNGLISWKLTHDSPLDDIVNPDGTHDLVCIKSTIVIEFPREYPFRPPVVFCSDSTQHPFLGEGNMIPFRRLRLAMIKFSSSIYKIKR